MIIKTTKLKNKKYELLHILGFDVALYIGIGFVIEKDYNENNTYTFYINILCFSYALILRRNYD